MNAGGRTGALSDGELARYARQMILPEFGALGQMRAKPARVAVVGAGGVGCPALLYLAAAGVGRLAVFDDDTVDASNLHRQILFADGQIGAPKAEVACARLRSVNPDGDYHPVPVRLGADNAGQHLGGYDVVLDGSDNFATRLAVADAALALRVPLVSAAIGGFSLQLGVFRGWEGDRPCYRCLVGDAVDRPGVSCADAGILGPAAGIAGTLAALEVLRLLSGFGADQAGFWLVFDLLTLATRRMTLPKDPACCCGR